ncbi:MAG: hypothetical protein K2R98_07720 [Gemmataceae bacterium]|nr:hypothetical protein [Gemmataceae bacterium]
MNAFWQYCLGLLAVGLVAKFAAAQAPGDTLPIAPPAAASPLVPPPVLAPADVCVPSSGAAACDRGGLIGGVGIYLIQPFFQHNPAYTVFTQTQVTRPPFNPNMPNTDTLGEKAERVSVHSHMAVAPLVWLGYVNDDGFGGRVRWWTFREGTSQTMNLPPFVGDIFIGNTTAIPGNPSHPVIAVTGTQATVSSAAPLGLQSFGNTVGIQHGAEATSFTVTTELYLQVGDLEAVQDFQAGGCDFLIAGGVRLAKINQTYNAYDAQSGSPLALRTLQSSYNFKGIGPTLALELRRPIADSSLSLYGTARGSIVFGDAQQNASFTGQELRNDDPNPQFATQHRVRAIPTGELEAGVEYGRTVGSSRLFGQIGLVGQEWFGAGSASRSTNATVQTTLRPVLGGAPIDSNIAFLGVSFRIGFDY